MQKEWLHLEFQPDSNPRFQVHSTVCESVELWWALNSGIQVKCSREACNDKTTIYDTIFYLTCFEHRFDLLFLEPPELFRLPCWTFRGLKPFQNSEPTDFLKKKHVQNLQKKCSETSLLFGCNVPTGMKIKQICRYMIYIYLYTQSSFAKRIAKVALISKCMETYIQVSSQGFWHCDCLSCCMFLAQVVQVQIPTTKPSTNTAIVESSTARKLGLPKPGLNGMAIGLPGQSQTGVNIEDTPPVTSQVCTVWI